MKPIDIKEEYGRRIKQIREKDDLTQKELGEKVGIDKQQISRYERGINQPSKEILDRIVQYGDVPPDFFKIGEQAPIYEAITIEQRKLIDNVKEILESGNDTMIEALKHNIKAFLEAIRVTKNQNEDKGGH